MSKHFSALVTRSPRARHRIQSTLDPQLYLLKPPRAVLELLVKQTYSVFVDYPKISRKWHLSPCIFAALPPAHANVRVTPDAYYMQELFESLRTIDDYPVLASIVVPPTSTSVHATTALGGTCTAAAALPRPLPRQATATATTRLRPRRAARPSLSSRRRRRRMP